MAAMVEGAAETTTVREGFKTQLGFKPIKMDHHISLRTRKEIEHFDGCAWGGAYNYAHVYTPIYVGLLRNQCSAQNILRIIIALHNPRIIQYNYHTNC